MKIMLVIKKMDVGVKTITQYNLVFFFKKEKQKKNKYYKKILLNQT